MYDFVTPSSP